MADLFWPGDQRAGLHFTDAAFLRAMVEVEARWLGRELEIPHDLDAVAREAEATGCPVAALVRRLRVEEPEVHRCLADQEVLDSALLLMAERAVADLRADLSRIVERLASLAEEHRQTPVASRPVEQSSGPTTFGSRVAGWLEAVLDAEDALAEPVTTRAHLPRLGDALAACTEACGQMAGEVAARSRPEIGELTEAGGTTVPHRAQPVLTTLIRRAALTTPQLAATRHVAAAQQDDDVGDAGWHAQCATLRDLVRRTLVAASQTADLATGQGVDTAAMAGALGDEKPSAAALDEAGRYVDQVLARAELSAAARSGGQRSSL